VKQVELDPAARAELDEAAARYDQDYEGRGLRFYTAVERVLQVIAALPESGHVYPGVRAELQVRRRLVPGFPFAIAYRISGEIIRVDAVIHTRRRPGYWRRRQQR
jgi:toxin ParE1/3/4